MGLSGFLSSGLDYRPTSYRCDFAGARAPVQDTRLTAWQTSPSETPAWSGQLDANEHLPSLGQALAGIPTELGLPSAVGFRVVVEGRQKKLKALSRDEVFRIGREAIINAYRHSGAKDIETEIEYRPTGLRIAVRDNGCGIDPQHVQRSRKPYWGLQGMRERAERMGARLRILSKVAFGTEVELCVPGQIAFE